MFGAAPHPTWRQKRRGTPSGSIETCTRPLCNRTGDTHLRVRRRSLIVPSFPFLLVRCASSLHIILFPPLLLAAFFLLLCAYFFSAAQPYNPHSYIYRHIFAVVWQTQHTWRCNLSSNLRRADFHSGAYTSTISMTLVYLQV